MIKFFVFTITILALDGSTALPNLHKILRKLDPDHRYKPMVHSNGSVILVDLWLTLGDYLGLTKYHPDVDIEYHLFTRNHPKDSQILRNRNESLLENSDFDPEKKTKILLHGWVESYHHPANIYLTEAFLEVEDANVIWVDWTKGSNVNYASALINSIPTAENVGKFISWLNTETGATPADYHIIGYSMGGHLAGMVARNVDGVVGYVTGLDPALAGFISNPHQFKPTDGAYTEVIHTHAGMSGHMGPLAHADFYPNGGILMRGCQFTDYYCHHACSYFYLIETILRGGFIGTECESLVHALAGRCTLEGRLPMGGIKPKTGRSGIYYLETNTAKSYGMAVARAGNKNYGTKHKNSKHETSKQRSAKQKSAKHKSTKHDHRI